MATPETTKSHHLTYQSNPLQLIKPSWAGFRRNWVAYLLWLVSVMLLLMIAMWLGFMTGLVSGLLIFAVVVLIASVYFGPSLYRITLAMARQEQVMFSDSFSSDWRLGVRLLLTQLLAAAVTVLGFVAVVIPGFLCLAWFAVVPYVVMEEKLWGMAALRRSRDLAKHRTVDMWGAIGLGSVVGVLAFVPYVGALVNVMVGFVLLPVIAIRYFQLKELSAREGGADVKTSVWNYPIIVLALAGTIVSFMASAQDSKTQAPSGTVEKSSSLY
jgi:hypothetical protein